MKRTANRLVMIAGLATLLFGCEVWSSVFSATEDEAIEVVSLVLNVFSDTAPFVTPEDVSLDPETGVLSYTSADGSYTFEYNVWGDVMTQTFDNYQPHFSNYLISGELAIACITWRPEVDLATTGDLTLSGGPVSTLTINMTLSGNLDEVSTAEFFGWVYVNGRELNNLEEWQLAEIGFSDFAVMYEIEEILSNQTTN